MAILDSDEDEEADGASVKPDTVTKRTETHFEDNQQSSSEDPGVLPVERTLDKEWSSDNRDEEEEEEEEPLVLNRRSRRPPQNSTPSNLSLHDVSENNLEKHLAKEREESTTRTPELIGDLPTTEHLSDEEDSPISPNRSRSSIRRMLRLSPDSDLESAATANSSHHASEEKRCHDAYADSSRREQTENETQSSPTRRRSLRRRLLRLSSETDDDHEQNADENVNSEEDELHKELEDLSQSMVVAERTRPRNRPTAFSKTLDDLKRRRLSNLSNDDSHQERDTREYGEEQGSYDEENDEGEEEDEENIDSEDDFVDSHFGVYTNQNEDDPPQTSQLTEVEDQDDLNFIVEDDSHDASEKRRLSSELVPEIFRLSNRQKLSMDFKVYCQYLLNLIFDRDFDEQIKNDEYFQSSIVHVVRTIETYQNSLSNSQVWDKQFKRDMESYPEYMSNFIGARHVNCQACSISNRPATFRVILTGTFEDWSELKPEYSDEETGDEDESGEQEENPKRVYYLGRFCHTRSKNYHAFFHWKFHVLQRMTIKVNEYMPKPFSTMSQRELDAIDTNDVMELLESSGYITRLWQELKTLINSARSISHAAD
ncbi:hypothetical protein BGW42_002862 [Actinomortierella wolfii]|nr:hypothetical protein BGW42_002862 [Actinomortierella wolfii]